jgi:hypothetical protein
MKIVLIILVLVLAILALAITSRVLSSKPRERTFTGKIEEIRNQCLVDGVCSIKVNTTWIITSGGKSTNNLSWGSTNGIDFHHPDKFIGKDVEVYAHTTGPENMSLEGSKKYYITLK